MNRKPPTVDYENIKTVESYQYFLSQKETFYKLAKKLAKPVTDYFQNI